MKVLLLSLYLIYLVAGQDSLLVKLEDGTQVQGHMTEDNTKQWLGIPYAAPPVNDLRFEYPQKPTPQLDKIYEANFNAPGCPQDCDLPDGSCSSFGYSEDCLYLTVNTPDGSNQPDEGYPVYFWIHGGAYTQGLGDCELYDGVSLAQQGIVNVVINYRLGALGFMASESMQGNYGVMDHIMALQWVQDNIAAFGGNPNKVTISGQSAGGESVGTIMTSPMTKGLYHAVIMQSNPLTLPMHTRESAAKNAADVFKFVGCDNNDIECMKKVPADDIVTAQSEAVKIDLRNLFINFLPFAPMVDPNQGPVPKQSFDVLQSGEFTPVPLLTGTVLQEGWLFVNELFTKPMKKSAYKGVLHMLFSHSQYKAVIDKYPYDLINDDETDGRIPLQELATDLMFTCPLRNVTRSFQTYQNTIGTGAADTYIYKFNHLISEDVWEPSNPYCVGWVCHGSELPFVFNSWNAGDLTVDITSDEKQLTKDTQQAWVNMITTWNPNQGHNSVPEPGYPLYDAQTDTIAVLDSPGFTNEKGTRSDFCDMWDSLGYSY